MKQAALILIATLLASGFNATDACCQTEQGTSNVMGVFVASTPCSEGTRPLPRIPVKADCEFIIWNLTLYQDPKTSTPTTYKLNYTYGLSQPSTPGFIGGGTKVEMEGKWTIVKGAGSNAGAIVYQLDTDRPNTSISFLKLNENLLHLLDSDKRLMIGNAGFSYTLNKLRNR
jgi:hypothetical protein